MDRNATSFAHARVLMVRNQLRPRGITDERVLHAMGAVQREEFVPPEYIDRAYDDGPLGIGHKQTISQPYMVALMTQALHLDPDAHVLEIGTGSGYQAAVLAKLARDVLTIEYVPELAENVRARLRRLGITNVTVITGDGSGGWADGAPYDGIIVTAGAPSLPAELTDQLAVGGRLVIPVGTRRKQMCLVAERTPKGIHTRELTACVFVPLLGAHGWKE